MATKAKQKRNAKQNAEHQRAFQKRRKEQEKARAELMAAFSAAAPEGIGEHISLSLAVENGEDRLVWHLDEAGAAFMNKFAATLKLSSGQTVPGQLVMRELSLHIGKKLSKGEVTWTDFCDSPRS